MNEIEIFKRLPSLEEVQHAQQYSEWNFGNQIVYKLCREHYYHDQADKNLTKVLFIGRIYADSVEQTESNDNFYSRVVAPIFRKSKLDAYLKELRTIETMSMDNIPLILTTHNILIEELQQITGKNKRSFSSKYLHFHCPELFFIYDSRVLRKMRYFISNTPKELLPLLGQTNIDITYAKFFCKCFQLKAAIKANYNIGLTNRELDNLLISSEEF